VWARPQTKFEEKTSQSLWTFLTQKKKGKEGKTIETRWSGGARGERREPQINDTKNAQSLTSIRTQKKMEREAWTIEKKRTGYEKAVLHFGKHRTT